MRDDISQLCVAHAMGADTSVRYRIPMYQRNYAWGEAEITQLLQDVVDCLGSERNYYVGSLVVSETHERGLYDVVDGQQRLTTLFLLTACIRNMQPSLVPTGVRQTLHFESRPHSEDTLAAVFEGNPGKLDPEQANQAILNGYETMLKVMPRMLRDHQSTLEQLASYLFQRVQIMRVTLPPGTDLNHYFEIMNSRGEQLEKHEVLKSRLLDVLTAEGEEAQSCFHRIWENCANMDRYVQAGFDAGERSRVFGPQWNRFCPRSFEELLQMLATTRSGDPAKGVDESIDSIIAGGPVQTRQPKPDDDERFHGVINFPNFLLHVLRVLHRQDIPLDDKRLLQTFEEHVLSKPDAIKRVKDFAFALLRCKFLLDQYVVKREFARGTDGWSLKSLRLYASGKANYVNSFGGDAELDNDPEAESLNRQILMLLCAFHVSTPTQVYKHWLNGALLHLHDAEGVEPRAYLEALESLAKAMVFERYLATNRSDYFSMIYRQGGRCRASRRDFDEQQLDARLAFGNIENNLVFNYLDYLLWLDHRGQDARIAAYEFTFRSSVEHYYPQRPLEGHAALAREVLDSFGNLCLISHEKNSRLSNFHPEAKKEHYVKSIDSVKQYLMLQQPEWNEGTIRVHGDAMKRVLLAVLD